MINIILFIVLIYIVRKHYKFKGQILATYLIGYGFIRAIIESLRTDSLMVGPFRVSRIVAIICIFLGFIIYFYNLKIKNIDRTSIIENDLPTDKNNDLTE